jgi:hypothetical protein
LLDINKPYKDYGKQSHTIFRGFRQIVWVSKWKNCNYFCLPEYILRDIMEKLRIR